MFLNRSFFNISLIFLLSAGTWFTGCDNDGNELISENNNQNQSSNERTFPGVDPELWSLYAQFEDEGRARGFDVDLKASGITGFIEEIEERHVAGRCNFNFRQPNRITIDEQFWERSSPLFKEMIVFHELGHCFLFRDHDETTLANGACESIMRSGTEDCIDNYNQRTRTRMIDELFDDSNILQ